MAGMLKRPILMGKMKTSGDPSIRDQLDPYLKRLRRTIEFPGTAEEIYFGCMPAVMRRLYDEGAFDPRQDKPPRVHNFVSCLSTSNEQVPIGRSDTTLSAIHVTVLEDAFWMYAPDNVPVPMYRAGSPFTLPLDHPKHDEIVAWLARALKIEDGIQNVFGVLAKLEIHAKSGAEIATVWPDLLNFVKYRRIMPPLPKNHARQLAERVDRDIPEEVKRFVTEMLATCVMLPERNTPLMGWVHSYMEGL